MHSRRHGPPRWLMIAGGVFGLLAVGKRMRARHSHRSHHAHGGRHARHPAVEEA